MSEEYQAYKDYQSNLELLAMLANISPGCKISLGDLEARVIANDNQDGISAQVIETVQKVGYNFVGVSVIPSICPKDGGKVYAIFTRKRDYKIPKDQRTKN